MTTYMATAEIRQRFLSYFAQKGHTIVPSSSLVPAHDPTLLFVNAGMVPFKDLFLAPDRQTMQRATSIQKCMRVSGKHNDLENVGSSPRHHTFFEMLGNFSFGEYFKRDAITFAWELLTGVFQLPIERLWFTVYRDDEEAAQLWQEMGAPAQRILRFGEADNFWSMGDTGPCGTNSEVHYYLGRDANAQVAEGVNADNDEYMELWNLVFMQSNRDAQGQLSPLPVPSVDTGMGMERIAMIMQGVERSYETDLFVPIIERIRTLLNADLAHYHEHQIAYHILADHSRALPFLIADGVRPGNEGRDYVLRRILRRAAYHGQTLGFARPFLADVANTVIDTMGAHYPDLVAKREYIGQLITSEETQFQRTLTTGLRLLEKSIAQTNQQDSPQFSGRTAFNLHDTYGFPLDLTQKVLAERGIAVNVQEYEEARREQQERSRAATRFKHEQEIRR